MNVHDPVKEIGVLNFDDVLSNHLSGFALVSFVIQLRPSDVRHERVDESLSIAQDRGLFTSPVQSQHEHLYLFEHLVIRGCDFSCHLHFSSMVATIWSANFIAAASLGKSKDLYVEPAFTDTLKCSSLPRGLV